VALLTWLLGIPIGILVARRRPVDARDYREAMGSPDD
jgi:hypothetical protein